MVMELEYVIAPLAAYMDFTQYYRQKNEKLYWNYIKNLLKLY